MSWPPPRGSTDDYAHRPRRVGLRESDARHRRQRGSTGGQMQKNSAGKFHFEPPSHHSITSSARTSTDGGISRPSAFAVLKFKAAMPAYRGVTAQFELALGWNFRRSTPTSPSTPNSSKVTAVSSVRTIRHPSARSRSPSCRGRSCFVQS
jgi:hypothetical protein